MRKWSAISGAAVLLGLVRLHDAAACSCAGPSLSLVGPKRVKDASLNTRIRVEMPASPSQGKGAVSANDIVLRAVDTGAKAEITERHWPDGYQIFVELAPTKPLAASTTYEVAIVDPSPTAYPKTTVLGAFTTGTVADVTAPKLDAVGTARVKGNAAGGGSCSIQGPWIEIAGVRASDPGRPSAKLMFGIWSDDGTGTLDTSKPPAALTEDYEGRVTIGQTNLCDPHHFPLPAKAPSVSLAIAAVDESGNMSAPHRLPKLTLSGVGAHP